MPVAIRVLALLLAAGVLAAAVTLPWFRDAEGYPVGRIAAPLAAATALVVLATGRAIGAAAAGWLGVALVGQAAGLQLMRAGNLVGYQHYVPLSDLAAPGVLPWTLLVAAEAVLVGVALVRGRTAVARILARIATPLRLAAVGLVFFLTAATLSRSPVVYAGELVFATFVQLCSLGAVVLAVVAVPADTIARLAPRLGRWFGAGAEEAGAGGGLDRFAVAGALWVTFAAALLCWVSYGRHPHVPDEVVYLYHARYFARGMLSMPAPPVPDAFNLDLMTYEAARWYSPVPPGWPAVLAIGAFLGAAWLVNPVLAGLNVLLAYVLVRDLYGRGTARLATLLLCASPWFLFMGMNFMTHTFTMTAALVAAVATVRARRSGGLGWAVLAGVAIGVMGLIRPLEGLTIAVLLGLWSLRGPRGVWRLRPAILMAVTAMATGAITLPYNRYFTGSATRFPLMAYTDAQYGPGSNALGFGANRGLGWPGLDPFPGHGPIDVLVNANLNAYQVNIELLGWATGSLLLLAVLLFCGRLRRADLLMLAVIAGIVGVHSFYWFSGGPDFGARYWYLILLPCIVLTARGLQELALLLSGGRSGDRAGNADAARSAVSTPAGVRVMLGAAALMLGTLVVFCPWRAVDKYHDYRGMRPDVRELASRMDFGRSLVLVRGNRFPDYASAAVYNPIDLQADAPVYAWDRSADVRDRVLRAYGDRPVWILDGPSITGAGYGVERGPVPAAELLREAVK